MDNYFIGGDVFRSWRQITFVVTLGLLFGSPSIAQPEGGEVVESAVVEEVVVTGSRIRRRDLSSVSPLITIDRSELQFAGRPTIEEVLNRMPQVTPDFGRTSNNPGDGTARVNLRGLGAGRTLVLLNGRRLAPSGVGSAVDLNNLPTGLIDRVEVITGGAAAVYGADAVAGVVNFITRDDFQGLTIEGQYGVTDSGDAETRDVSVAYGVDLSEGRGHLTLFANAMERDTLLAGERAFTQTDLEDDLMGGVRPRGSFAVPELLLFAPVDLGIGPVFPIFEPDGNFRAFQNPDDRYNFAPVNYLQTPLTRFSAGLFANFALTTSAEVYAELSFANNQSEQQFAAIPATGVLTTNLDNPLLTPATRALLAENFATGDNRASVNFGRRLIEVGQRAVDRDRDYWRTVFGVRGTIWGDWGYDAWLGFTDATERELLLNDASRSRLAQGLLVDPATGGCIDPSGGCVPVNPFGAGNISPEAADFLRVGNVVNTTERTQTLAGAFITGSLLEGWAGPLEVAAGLTYRRDEGDFQADDVLSTGDTLGFRGESAISGSEDVLEVYAEAVLPLLVDQPGADYLGLEAGLRYSDYDLAGGQTTHKLGLEWAPGPNFRLRAMQQRSVRAPNLAELFAEQFIELGSATSVNQPDPCSASLDPVGNGIDDKCRLQGLTDAQLGVFEAADITPATFIRGGNPELQPETADTLTVGFVLEPERFAGWSLAVDYFEFDVEDAIGQIDPFSICFDSTNTGNVFCENIQRGPDGNIRVVSEPISNRGLLEVNGIDTQLRVSKELPRSAALGQGSADLTLTASWSHLLEYRQQENPVSRVLDCAGRFGRPCFDGEVFDGAQTFPENRVTTQAHYRAGPWSAHVTWQWIEGTDNAAPLRVAFQNLSNPIQGVPDVGSKSYVDVGIGYAFGRGAEVRLNVNNLFDTSPPLMADAVVQNNTDSGLYDVLGRSFFASFTTRFGQ
ncbi:MAG: TonB-dependent receptor [Pseudomonadota bacterium]